MTRFAPIFALIMLTACGFQPMQSRAYRESLNVDLSSLIIEASGTNATPNATSVVPRRYGELLTAEIQDQINPSGRRGEKRFKLAIEFSETESALFVNPDGTASRGDLTYNSSYTISSLVDGKRIATGSLVRTSSYNTSPTADYASYVSIEDARKRGILELAQDYKLRLAALLPTLNDPNAVAAEPKLPDQTLPVLQPVKGYETLRSGY